MNQEPNLHALNAHSSYEFREDSRIALYREKSSVMTRLLVIIVHQLIAF